jgi:hypothetical protein
VDVECLAVVDGDSTELEAAEALPRAEVQHELRGVGDGELIRCFVARDLDRFLDRGISLGGLDHSRRSVSACGSRAGGGSGRAAS